MDSEKKRYIAVKIYHSETKSHLKTFKIDVKCLISEISNPNSPLHINNISHVNDSVSLFYKDWTIDDYTVILKLIRTNTEKRPSLLSKILRDTELKEVIKIYHNLETVGANQIKDEINEYLYYWKSENLDMHEDMFFISFNKESSTIILRKQVKCTFKSIPSGALKETFFYFIQKKYPTAKILQKGSNGITITFIKVSGTIMIQDMNIDRYISKINAHKDDVYCASNILSERIDDFFGQVLKTCQRNGFKISIETTEKLKISLLERKIKESNITGVVSLLRESLRYYNVFNIRILEKSIYQVISSCIDDTFTIFDVLFTIFLLDLNGFLSDQTLDTYNISITMLFTHFFSDKFKIQNMNPDIVYNFLLSFVPNELFKNYGHIYISLPEKQRIYPKYDNMEIVRSAGSFEDKDF